MLGCSCEIHSRISFRLRCLGGRLYVDRSRAVALGRGCAVCKTRVGAAVVDATTTMAVDIINDVAAIATDTCVAFAAVIS